MSDIGAKVWTLALGSAVQGPTDEHGCGEWIHGSCFNAKRFVLLEDYEKALKRILDLQDTPLEVGRFRLWKDNYGLWITRDDDEGGVFDESKLEKVLERFYEEWF